MGGGSSGQGMQTSGGMTVYNGLGYDPSQPQGGGINWGQVFSGGLSSFGKGMSAAGSTPPSSGATPESPSPFVIQPQQVTPPIPQNNLIDALMRILGGN